MFIIVIIIFILINILTSILYNYNIIVPKTNTVLQQFLAWLLIVSHDILSALILILIMMCIIGLIKNKCFLLPLIILDIIVIIFIISFLFHKMCVLTIYYNKVTNQPYCTPYKSSPSIILNFILRKNNEQKNITDILSYKKIKCVDNYIGWTDANLVNTIIILILNLCVLSRYYINNQ